MKGKKRLFLLVPIIMLFFSVIALVFYLNLKHSMFPYKEKKEIAECIDYFSRVRDKEKRAEFLKNYVKKYFDIIEVHRLYQDFMIRMGEKSYIKKEYENYLEDNPDDPKFNYLFGRLLSSDDAEFYFKKSLLNNVDFYWGHLGLSYNYFHHYNPPKTELALEHLESAIKIDKTKPNAYFSLLTNYRFKKNNEKMLEVLEILIKFFPERDYLFLEYAELRFKNKEEFKKAIEKKLKRIRESALLKKTLADLYLYEGKIDEALKYLESALEDEKYDNDLIKVLHMQLADIHGSKKDEKKTIYHLKEAAKYGIKNYEWIKENKNFEFLKENKEFKDLLKEIEPGQN